MPIKPIPQRKNANRHNPRGMQALENSIATDGWIGAITVAADGETFDGSARVEKTAENGMLDAAIVIDIDGSKPVVLRRVDIPTATDPRAIRLGVASNRVASLNLEWEPDVLAGIAESGIDLGSLFTEMEWANASMAEPVDPAELWKGMPDFEHEDQTADAAFIIRVFLKDADDLAAFGKLLGKDLTDRKFVWFSKQPQGETYEAVE
jgi:hypothetical protein